MLQRFMALWKNKGESPPELRLVLRCARCNRVLGEYEGEEFYIAGKWVRDAVVFCPECWEKLSFRSPNFPWR
jgi:phage FluMu protein Com